MMLQNKKISKVQQQNLCLILSQSHRTDKLFGTIKNPYQAPEIILPILSRVVLFWKVKCYLRKVSKAGVVHMKL